MAFGSNLVVFLGALDDENEVRGDLVRTPEVDVQGISRIARGKHFYGMAVKTATTLGIELKWRLEVVPGVGHDLGLIRFGGHLPRGGYDVQHGRPETETSPAQLHRGVQGRRGAPGPG